MDCMLFGIRYWGGAIHGTGPYFSVPSVFSVVQSGLLK